MIPGEYVFADGDITINEGRATSEVEVVNRGDRPVQIGSHFHVAEINPAVEFDREAAWGYRLDIPAGTAVRLEPGDATRIPLVAIGGRREVYGLANLTDGRLDDLAPNAPRSTADGRTDEPREGR